jgi:hypothetical protein
VTDKPLSYEALVYTAHLPTRTVAFIFPEEGIPFTGGVFRIEYLRPASETDSAAFPTPDDGVCGLCGHVEEWLVREMLDAREKEPAQ